MTDLLDIAPAVETVKIGEVEVRCYGISAGDLVRLVQRFPTLRNALWNGRAQQPGESTIDASSLIGEAPDAIAAILAAGNKHFGEPEYEEAADRMAIDQQADLLKAILRMTLPQGLGPLVEKLMGLFGAVSDEMLKLPVTGSEESGQPLPNGKAAESHITSPQPLNG